MIVVLIILLIVNVATLAFAFAISKYLVNFKNEYDKFREYQIAFMQKATKRMPRLYGEDEIL